MPDIWHWKDDGTEHGKWSIVGTSSFEHERALQERIAASPEMLPLSGQPLLTAAFREVGLGGGRADVLAFEDNGRPCIIEVKLKEHPEAKRAVVAQALTYAAGLRGIEVRKLEGETLKEPLQGKRLVEVVQESLDGDNFDEGAFYENLGKHLAAGSFRIVIVLDDAPPQLVSLIGYLDLFTTKDLSLDLVTVSAYDIKDEHFLIPQRIDPEHAIQPEPATETTVHSRPSRRATATKGSAPFRKFVAQSASPDHRTNGQRIADWADGLENEGICRVYSKEGGGWSRIRLHLLDENKTFAHFESDGQGAWLYPTVIQRRAPAMLDRIRELTVTGVPGNKGGAPATPELLDALADAYREAAGVASDP